MAAFLGALALATYAKTDQGFWIAASLLLIYPLLNLTLIPHELGHALAAWLMGFELTQIQFGSGRTQWAAIIAGVEISFGSVPFGGSTKFGAPSARWFRARMIVVSIAGPVANLACIWVTIRLVAGHQSQSHTLPNLYVIPVWLLANLLVVVANLTPTKDRDSARPTDGLIVWRMLWKPVPEELRGNLPMMAPFNKSFRFLRKSKYESAERNARRAYELAPERPETRLALGMALCYSGKGVEGEPLLRGLLRSEQPTAIAPSFRASVQAQLALMGILSPDSTRWAEARDLAVSAYEELPWDNGVTLVYGACLALTGDSEAGLAALATAIPPTKDSRDFCIFVRALVLARAGHTVEAADVLRTARAQKHFDIFRAAIESLIAGQHTAGTRAAASGDASTSLEGGDFAG